MSDELLDEITDWQRVDVPAEVKVRSASKRELEIRLLPWNTTIETVDGLEEYARGAFDGIDPGKVLLTPPEHEVRLGIGQDGKARMVRRPTGKGISYEDREDGPVMVFKLARTQDADEQLALAEDGIVTGASIEVGHGKGTSHVTRVGGRRKTVHTRSDLRGVTTTYEPAYGEQAAVLAARARLQEDQEVAEDTQPVVDYGSRLDGIDAAIGALRTDFGARSADPAAIQAVMDKLDAMDEHARAQFALPAIADKPDGEINFTRGAWTKLVLRMLSGEKVDQRELDVRVAAELITTDNLGVLPEQFLPEIIGIIDPARPFLGTTRRLRTPDAGLTFTVPVIGTRPTVGVQAAEKDELASTTTAITDTSFTPLTIGGYGDISIQLLRRSDPSYLDLYLELLAEAYAIMADDKAVDALLAASGILSGGTVVADEGPQFGQAWANAMAVSRRLAPDHIWMSSSAVQAFIDAKSDTTNAPLYSNIAANFTAGGGTGGQISGLTPVHVPALDDESVDIIVGPSRGFAWAEDGTFTLQIDVPAKAGRDVALVGMIWFMPLYPAAFTTYALGS